MELFARRAITEAMWDAQMDSGYRNAAEVRVDQNSALSDDAILAAVSLLAGDIAGLPWRALITDDTGLSQPLPRQPSWIEAPDPLDFAITDVAHRMQVALSILLDGNVYTLCEPSILDPVRLTVLDPTTVEPIKPGNERLFEVRDAGKVIDTLSSAQVLHTPYLLRPGRLKGLSPIAAQSGNLGISIAMRKWVESFFGKGGQVSGLVSLPLGAQQQDVDTVQDRIQSKWSGWRRAGVIGVLAGGATWVKTGLSPQDADLGTLWRRQLEMAARIYGIPPFMIGSQEPAGVAYASSVERAQHYIDHCLARYTRPIEKAYSRLVPGDGRRAVPGSNTEVRFVFDAFLRGDPKARWESYLTQLQAKARTIGEVRALENLKPLSAYPAEYLSGPDGLYETPQNNAPDPAPTDPTPADQPPTQRALADVHAEAEHRARMEAIARVTNLDALDALTDAVRNQPATVVNVAPAEVNVAVPEQQAPVVEVHVAAAEVHIPEQPAPIVNVAAPEVHIDPVVIPAPEVHVEAARAVAPTVQDIRIVGMPPLKARVKKNANGTTTITEEP